MNPNLDRNKAYLRVGAKFYSPVKENGARDCLKVFASINEAKKESREKMKLGFTVVTKC